MDKAPRILIPERFLKVPYRSSHYPGAAGVSGVEDGANCQQFAYELLRHFGHAIPDFRSSDLWGDSVHTVQVTDWMPLDLLLFHNQPEAYGAHVGVYLGNDQVLHLAKEVGLPAVWSLEMFAHHPHYFIFIGAKRIVASSNEGASS